MMARSLLPAAAAGVANPARKLCPGQGHLRRDCPRPRPATEQRRRNHHRGRGCPSWGRLSTPHRSHGVCCRPSGRFLGGSQTAQGLAAVIGQVKRRLECGQVDV